MAYGVLYLVLLVANALLIVNSAMLPFHLRASIRLLHLRIIKLSP
jgi:hypothetical protein